MVLNRRNSAAAAVLLALAGASPVVAADDLSQGVPSKEALARKTGLKLAGLATFVASSCPDLKLNQARFKSAITAFGLTTKDLDQEPTKFAYLQYTMAYKKDVKESCTRARTQFGPDGKTLPNLFAIVDKPAKPPTAGSKGLEKASGTTPETKKP